MGRSWTRLACLSVSAWTSVALAAPIESVTTDVNGTPTRAITWTDAKGQPRTVHVLTDNHRIVRYEYTIDDQPVVDDAVGDYGIGNFVNHGGCDAGAVVTWAGVLDYSAEAALTGPHHFIWQSTFRFTMCSNPDVTWRITNEYLFITGEDGFIQTATYDASDLPSTEAVGDDMRGPYNQTTWPGSGAISGFGWGSEYKFVTTEPIPDGDANTAGGVAVSWDWSVPNTIPYVWEWADPSQGGAVDREYGVVQNQPYAEQDFGGGFYACEGCFPTSPPTSGDALPAVWALPSQMSGYDSNYRSGRITWGQTYGTFENGHSNDTGTIADMGDHFRPVNAWSWTHVVGKFTEGGLTARVRDTENAYATSFTAEIGSRHTEGPRGPGNFVGPSVGEMPRIAWSRPGLDFVYRTWNVSANAGAAEVSFDVRESLRHPVLVVHDFPSAEAVVRLDAVELEGESDYYASYDAEQQKLWLTLATVLDDGAHSVEVEVASGDDMGGTGGTAGSGGAPMGGTGGSGGGETTNGGGGDDMGGAGESADGETSSGGSESATGGGDGGSTADATASTTDAGSSNGDDSNDGGCSCSHGSPRSHQHLVFAALSLLAWRRRTRGALPLERASRST